MVEITGEIVAIIYRNEISGYTICNISGADDEDVTVVGFLPYVQEGEEVKVFGNWVNHPDYGKQLKVETFEKVMPKGIPAIEKYLASGIIKGAFMSASRRRRPARPIFIPRRVWKDRGRASALTSIFITARSSLMMTTGCI